LQQLRKAVLSVLCALSVSFGLTATAQAADRGAGVPDTSFGNQASPGTRLYDILGVDILAKVLRQPDGKLVLVGTAGDNIGNPLTNTDDVDRIAVARVLPTNAGSTPPTLAGETLDPSFSPGVQGYSSTQDPEPVYGVYVVPQDLFGINNASHASGAALDAAGNILIAGWYFDAGNGIHPVVLRITPLGLLDTSFGNAGVVTLEPMLDGATPLGGQALAVVTNGSRIIVAGVSGGPQGSAFVARLLGDGTPDPSFDSNLITGTSQPGFSHFSADPAMALAVDATGDVLVAGGGPLHGGYLRRLDGKTGEFDTAFAGGGSYDLPPASNTSGFTSVTLAPSGRIVLTGVRAFGVSDVESYVVRLLADGTGDPTFGSGGVVRDDTIAGNRKTLTYSSIVDADERIYTLSAGPDDDSPTQDVYVVRYLPDGRRDPGWGDDGLGRTKLGPAGNIDDTPGTLLGLPDGRVIVGSSAIQWTITRLTGDGTFPSFDRGDIDSIGGLGRGNPNDVPMVPEDVLVTPDGTTYVATVTAVYKVTGSYGGGHAEPVLGTGVSCASCLSGSAFPRLATDVPISGANALAWDDTRKVLFVGLGTGAVLGIDQAGIARLLIAGAPGGPDTGDGSLASAATNGGLSGLEFDSANRTLFMATHQTRVRMVQVDAVTGDLANMIPLVNAADLPAGYGGDGGPAQDARFQSITDIAIDPATDDLYVADFGGNRVRRVRNGSGTISPADTVETFYGDGTGALPTAGPPASVSATGAYGLAIGSGHTLAVSLTLSHQIARINLDAPTVTLAGTGAFGEGNGPVSFHNQRGIDYDPTNGTIVVADQLNNLVRRTDGATASRVAGTARRSRGGSLNTRSDDAADVATFDLPTGLAMRRNPGTQANELWVSEGGLNGQGGSTLFSIDGDSVDEHLNGSPSGGLADIEWSPVHQRFIFTALQAHKVYAYDPVGDTLEVVAGGSVGDALGNGSAAQFSQPSGIAVQGPNIYVADRNNHKVKGISSYSPGVPNSAVVSLVLGDGTPAVSPDGTPASSASISAPTDVFADPSRGLLIAEGGSNRVRNLVRTEGTNVTTVLQTVVGTGVLGVPIDGQPAATSKVGIIRGLAGDRAGNLYVSDSLQRRVYQVDAGGTIRTIAGGGQQHVPADLQPAIGAGLSSPSGLALDEDAGLLYIADPLQNLVRKIRLLPRAVPAAKGPGRIIYSQAGAGSVGLDIFVANDDMSSAVNVTPGRLGNQTDPEISPDGTRVLYVSDELGQHEVFVADADGGNRVNVSTDPGFDADPTWVDNDRVAFVHDTGSGFDLFRRSAPRGGALGSLQQLTNTPGFSEGYPDVNPVTGAFVLRGTPAGEDTDLYTLAPNGGTPVLFRGSLGNDGLTENEPAWSPDGQRVVYVRDDVSSQNIVVTDPSGPDVRLTNDAARSDGVPQFTPDGRRVVFQTRAGSSYYGIDSMATDGSGRVSLSRDGQLGGPHVVNTTSVTPGHGSLPATPARVPLSAIPLQPSGAAGVPASGVGATGPIDLNRLLKLPVDLNRLLKLPVDLNRLLKLPVDLNRLLKLPVDLNRLLKLPSVQTALSTPISAMPPEPVWDEIIAGTPFEGRSHQTITLADILSNPTTRDRFEQHSVLDFNFSQTAFANISVQSYALGTLPAKATGIPSAELCAAFEAQGHPSCGDDLFPDDPRDGRDLSMLDLELAGIDIAPLRIASRSWAGFDFAQAPTTPPVLATLLARQAGGLDLEDTDLGTIPLGALGAAQGAIVDCTKISCTGSPSPTLEQAQAANAIRPTAKVADLDAVIDRVRVGGQPLPINQVFDLLLSRSAQSQSGVPVEQLGVLDYTTGPADADQTAIVSYAPSGLDVVEDPVVTLALPAGATFVGTDVIAPAGAATSITRTGSAVTVRFPASAAGELLAVHAGEKLVLSVRYRVGLRTGPAALPSIDVTGSGAHQRDTNVGASTVTDNEFNTGPLVASAKTIVPTVRAADGTDQQAGEIAFVFIQDKADHQLLRIPAPPGGSRLRIDVEHAPVDVDMAVYQPPATGALAPVRPFPAGSPMVNPLQDTRPTIVSKGNVAPSDAQQDFPFLLTDRVVAGFTNKRGLTDEAIEVTAVDGATGDYVVQISGYQGASANTPLTVRATIVLPSAAGACAARSFPSALDETLMAPPPTSVPAGRTSLILTNLSRVGRLYGSQAALDLGAKLDALAARVNGYVLSVDRFQAVRDAYDTWDQVGNRCDPLAANAVGRAINTAVDGLFGPARADLRYINLAGSDDVLPATRSFDFTQRVNESSFVATASPDGVANPIAGAFARGFLLTDDGYADFAPEPWLGAALYLPDVAIGRLVETPAEIGGAIQRALDANLTLNPTSAYTSGYDFFDDYAAQVDEALSRVPGITAHQSQVSTGNAASALAALRLPVGIASVNGHGLPTAIETPAGDSVTAAALATSSTGGALIFSIACHGGLNLPDATVGAASTLDLTQAASRSGASGFVGNTGYGLALKDGIGLSERIYLDFARNLKDLDVGTALAYAKQQYRASETVDNVFAAKALQVAGLSGIPQLKLSVASGAVTTPTSARPAAFDPALGMYVEAVSVGGAGYGAGFNRHVVAGEVFYDHDGRSTRIVGQPVQPVYSEPVRPGATDVLITGLTTEVRAGDQLINPVVHHAVVTGQGELVQPEPADGSTTADFATVRQLRAPDGARAQLNLIAGQFVAAGLAANGQAVGQQRLVKSAELKAIDNGPADGKRPIIAHSDGVIVDVPGGRAASFVVDAWDPRPGDLRAAVHGVLVLSLEKAANGTGVWSLTRLAPDAADPFRWSGAVPTAPVGGRVEYFVQAWDGQLVGRSDFKDAFYVADAVPPAPVGLLDAAITGPSAGAGYRRSATVTLTPAGGAEYRIAEGAWTPYTAPFTITEDGSHRVAYRNAATALETVVLVDGHAPIVTVAPGGATYDWNEEVATAPLVACHDGGSGLADCTVTPASLDTSSAGPVDRVAQLTIVGRDVAGNEVTQQVAYAYKVNVLPTLAVTGTLVAGVYLDQATFTAAPSAGASISLDGAPPTPYGGPLVVTADGPHTVSVSNAAGSVSRAVTVDAAAPAVAIAPGGATYDVDATVFTDGLVTCLDPTSGIARCDVSPPALDTSGVGAVDRVATITVVAKDHAGHQVTAQLPYAYQVRVAPMLAVTGATVGGVFVDEATVNVQPGDGATITVDGVATPYAGPRTITGDGQHTISATNRAGTATQVITIDGQAPAATPAAPATFALNGSASSAGRAVCADRLAVTRCQVVAPTMLDTSGVGSRTTTLTVETIDAAGHIATRSVVYGYTVTYVFDGVQAPLKDSPSVNAVPALLPVPVRWQLRDARGALAGGATATVTRGTMPCPGWQTTIPTASLADPLVALQAENTTTYDPATGMYRYRITGGVSERGKCIRVRIAPGDGTLHEVRFIFI
jgi:uncharacterized delta-60 repeat protein